MIINEAAFALQENVATAADIDMAMKLGTNYPKGPLAWCDEIGAYTVVAILEALQIEYGHDRYRVAPLLRLKAEAGRNFLNKEYMIAFLGTGLLGSNWVRAMRKRGEEVHVWNRTGSKAKALESDGAKVFATPAEAVKARTEFFSPFPTMQQSILSRTGIT